MGETSGCPYLYTMKTMNTISAVPKRKHAYRLLRGEHLSRVLRPGGRLREIPLAARLGVSRIPLREAIDQLASEGLVCRVPGLGSHARSASPQVLRDFYEMREVLDCFTVEKAAGRMTGAQLGGGWETSASPTGGAREAA